MNLQSIKQRFGIIGRSEALDRALDTAVRVASTDLSVLITGESGVGKEVFSKIIHSLSPRKHNKFIAVNCGAIPAGTINSELFGHEKGAFTGATSDRKGYFETVDGGTIFLDEIGEMPLDTQAYLLRVLESGEFIKVGSSKALRTDVRVVAATNVNLTEKIKKGKFREDLYYRLRRVPIEVPALRERKEDIYMLFRKFAVDFAEKYHTSPIQLDEKSRLLLENYRWPGNIRELRNIAEQISVLSEDRVVTAEDLIEYIPNILNRNLPTLHHSEQESSDNGMQEREILYKLLFDMKKDMNDLKGLLFEVINRNDLSVPDVRQFNQLQVQAVETYKPSPSFHSERPTFTPTPNHDDDYYETDSGVDIILNGEHDEYDNAEVLEENLSLEENEKNLIRRALEKHNGRRKDAAGDLGISERTLYRKIKEYDL